MKYLSFTDLLDSEPANLAILSTYQFEPDFFEQQLLRCTALAKARRILVFLDSSQWYTLLRQDTPARLLNRRYLVVPVRRSQGVFHPKLTLLLSEQGGQVHCGSNNLTRSGCTSNLELLNSFTVGREGEHEEAKKIAQEAYRFFNRVCNDAEDEPGKIGRKWIEEASKGSSWLAESIPANASRSVRLLHTYDGSLWDRLAAVLDEASPSRFLVMSPFHDHDGEMFERVHRRWPKCRVEILVQQEYTNLSVKSLDKLKKSVDLFEVRNSKGRVHAKLVAWEGNSGSGCLVGSANFTTAAFDARNIETCLVMSNTADLVNALFDKELQKCPINLEDFVPGSPQEPGTEEKQAMNLKLRSALLLGDGQLRVSYETRLPVKPSSLRVAVRFAGERDPHAFAALSENSGTTTVSFRPEALNVAYGIILASLIADFPSSPPQESAMLWIIQEDQLTYESSGEGTSSNERKVEETGDGLIELLEEIAKRDGIAAAVERLRHLSIRFYDGSGGVQFSRKFRLKMRDPFHADIAPEWLISARGKTDDLRMAIYDFVERHEKQGLRKHAKNGYINGMDNFLDILTALVRLLYVYHKKRGVVKADKLIEHLLLFIELATIGREAFGENTAKESFNGYLTSVFASLDGDVELLRKVCGETNYVAQVRAVLLIAQSVRFEQNPDLLSSSPQPTRPRNALTYYAGAVKKAFSKSGLIEPQPAEVRKALEDYQMFSEEEIHRLLEELPAH